MKYSKTYLILILNFQFLIFNSFSQNTTKSPKTNPEREVQALHKAMIIPFEPRLYLSEIDHHINAETKFSAREIKYKFRDGINDQLYKAFKSAKYNVLDLMEDTLKYKKETEGIYQYLTYNYQLIPDQNNYHPPKTEKEEKTIEKGQLNIETDLEARFMNAKLVNEKIFTSLNSKYKTDIFVFINQLEIKAAGSKNPGELGNPNPDRKIVLHYTVFNKEHKEINSGTAETTFEFALNNPKKIIEKHFAKLAAMIVQRTNKALVIVK